MSLITHNHQKGFTLLELMVTVAIVGILAAIAIPIYNNYITKTRIADALAHGRVYAGKVTIDRENPVDPPANLEYSTISLAGSEENPRVRIKLKETIDSRVLIDPDEWAGGKVIVLSEESSDASIRWACTTNLPQALIPEGCTYEAGVRERKLLTEWTPGNEACWSPERFARGIGGWAVGSCTNCNQKAMQRKAGRARRTPGRAHSGSRVLWEWGATCSGQYGASEVVLSTDIGAPWQNVPVDERKTVTPCWDRAYANDERDGLWVVGRNNVPAGQEKLLRLSADSGSHVGFGFELSCQHCKATEAYCAEGAFAEEEEARVAAEERREEEWDRLIASGESTDGIPWATVPEKERETYPSCWNGASNRWEVGSNYCDLADICTVNGECGDRNPCIKDSRKRANESKKPNVGDDDPYLHCQIDMH